MEIKTDLAAVWNTLKINEGSKKQGAEKPSPYDLGLSIKSTLLPRPVGFTSNGNCGGEESRQCPTTQCPPPTWGSMHCVSVGCK